MNKEEAEAAVWALMDEWEIKRNIEMWRCAYIEAVKNPPQAKIVDGMCFIESPESIFIGLDWVFSAGVMQVRLKIYANSQEFAEAVITHFDSQKSYIGECAVQYPHQYVSYSWNSETLSDAMNEFFEFVFVPESVLQERCANALGS